MKLQKLMLILVGMVLAWKPFRVLVHVSYIGGIIISGFLGYYIGKH